MSAHAGRGEQSRQSGSSPPVSTQCGLFQREVAYYSGSRSSNLRKTRITNPRLLAKVDQLADLRWAKVAAAAWHFRECIEVPVAAQGDPKYRVLDGAAEAGVAA